MEQGNPEEEKTTCLICGASFLVRTALQTGWICRRHRQWVRPIPGMKPPADPDFVVISPEGKLILSAQKIPPLPLPRKIVVGPGYLEIDGWFFRTAPFPDSLISWLIKTSDGWRSENPPQASIDQIRDLAETLERQLKRGEYKPCMPGSRWKVG